MAWSWTPRTNVTKLLSIVIYCHSIVFLSRCSKLTLLWNGRNYNGIVLWHWPLVSSLKYCSFFISRNSRIKITAVINSVLFCNIVTWMRVQSDLTFMAWTGRSSKRSWMDFILEKPTWGQSYWNFFVLASTAGISASKARVGIRLWTGTWPYSQILDKLVKNCQVKRSLITMVRTKCSCLIIEAFSDKKVL